MDEPLTLATHARKLAGQAALLLGWRPDDFWSATPEDLAIALEALGATQPDEVGVDGAMMAQLQEQFPDG